MLYTDNGGAVKGYLCSIYIFCSMSSLKPLKNMIDYVQAWNIFANKKIFLKCSE